MLYRYIIENFRSFRDSTEWSLIPTNSRDIENKGIQIQNMNAIYGANASGKTTLVKSLAYMRDVITKSNDILVRRENQCYKMDSEYANKPTVFHVQVLVSGVLYDYGFSYLYKKGQIIAEWLYQIEENQEKEIFTRELKKDAYIINFPGIYSDKDMNAIDVYRSDMLNSYSSLLLSELAKKNINIDIIDASKAVVHWFDRLVIIFPDSKYNLTRNVSEDEEEVNLLFSENFKKFGIDIAKSKLEVIPPKYLKELEADIEELREDLRKDRAKGVNSHIIVNIDSTPILFELDNAGDIKAQEVVFVHEYAGSKGATLHWTEESDGTNRLFDIIPIAQLIKESPSVVIVDELDRSLHSNLTKHFVRSIKELLVNTQSQFLFTTHDTMLMDTSLLKRDEIWMVDKKAGVSYLIPLAQFKLKNSAYIRENYLLGRYGGISQLQ